MAGDTLDEAAAYRPPGFWARLRRWFSQADDLAVLTEAIERFPEAPANYVLRGERYLALKQYDQAGADFRQALALIDVEREDWGVVAQALRDRAQHGLSIVERRSNEHHE